MRGGRLIREVVAHGGSTVCVELRLYVLNFVVSTAMGVIYTKLG